MREEAGQRVLAVFGAVHARDLGEASDEAFDGARDAAERVGNERDDGVALDVDGVVRGAWGACSPLLFACASGKKSGGRREDLQKNLIQSSNM